MTTSRRKFLHSAFALPLLSVPLWKVSGNDFYEGPDQHLKNEMPAWPVPDLHLAIEQPVTIGAVELLKTQGELMLRVTATSGVKGITQCNDRMQHLTSLLKGLVIPHFLNKDARNIASLVDNAYRLNSNYKYAGMPLWNCIGSVEVAVWDLLGRIAAKPAYELLGTPVRSEYEVYISDFNRDGDPQKITDQLGAKLDATGAKGVKIKVGGRMVNTPKDTTQTRRYVPVVRKVLGDNVVIYADANGSYSAEEGIEMGYMLQDQGVAIFEEPCNFEDESSMRRVNDALTKLRLAGGEQDTSLYKFLRLAETNVYDVLQPDVYYHGGILRTLAVAMIAKAFGDKGLAPHTPKSDPLIAPFWQVAALIPNLYGLQECVYNLGQKSPSWHSPIDVVGGKITIPRRPGLGIDYDEGIWERAEKVI